MVLLTGDVFQQYKDEQFRKGLYVKATIKIQSYVNDVKNEDGSTGKRYHQESFVQTLERVAPIPGDFDELSRFPRPINRGVLEGELVNIYRLSGNIVRMTILTITDERRSYVTCYRNMPNAQRVVDKLRVGDQLHLECYLTNQQKEHDGKIVHYQDVMIRSYHDHVIIRKSSLFLELFLYVKIFSFEIFHIYIEKKNQIKFYIKEKAYD